jgi:hypothetical protein
MQTSGVAPAGVVIARVDHAKTIAAGENPTPPGQEMALTV